MEDIIQHIFCFNNLNCFVLGVPTIQRVAGMINNDMKGNPVL
ncbi:hypothetical protein AsAng_0002420 [Aureispira anguillae]|uniref:Uncharacterized protein n=1 Tax=Aureispira anguillae TaxID=2864201 RepID=A0A915YAS5_9BACT|nr:hypothetical protein AsAng_0002420 [Aureispira anguillae]